MALKSTLHVAGHRQLNQVLKGNDTFSRYCGTLVFKRFAGDKTWANQLDLRRRLVTFASSPWKTLRVRWKTPPDPSADLVHPFDIDCPHQIAAQVYDGAFLPLLALRHIRIYNPLLTPTATHFTAKEIQKTLEAIQTSNMCSLRSVEIYQEPDTYCSPWPGKSKIYFPEKPSYRPLSSVLPKLIERWEKDETGDVQRGFRYEMPRLLPEKKEPSYGDMD